MKTDGFCKEMVSGLYYVGVYNLLLGLINWGGEFVISSGDLQFSGGALIILSIILSFVTSGTQSKGDAKNG